MSLSDHQWEFLKDVSALIHWAERRGYKVTGGELYRTAAQQEIYLEEDKTNAKESFHQKRLAIDLNLFIDNEYQRASEAYRPLGEFWESLSEENRWGGNFTTINDGNHFERAV